MFLRISTISTFLMIFLFTGCNVNPVSDSWPDQIEFESVYQHIKIYSIYQDSSKPGDFPNNLDHFPQNPFFFKSISAMFDSIHDTLKHGVYARYAPEYDDPSNLQGALFPQNQTDTIVFLDTLTDSTVYLKIKNFLGNPFEQFSSVIYGAKGFPNIVVDLRGNGGGDLNELDSIVEAFVPRGSKYIMIRERKYDPDTKSGYTLDWHPQITTKYPDPALDKKKISVLMDNGTASAAEILASALKDCVNAFLIGDHSYGKGMGQSIFIRRHRPAFELTTLQIQGMTKRTGYYHEKGIEPDTIPSDIKTEGERSILLQDLYKRNIFYAVKMLEPGANVNSIKFPPKPKSLGKAVSGYKTVYDTLNP